MKHKARIIELRKQGRSYRQIETLLGCTRSTVSYHCRKLDLQTLPKSPTVLPFPAIVARLVVDGVSRVQIAEALGVPHKAVIRWCKERNLCSQNTLSGYPRLKLHRKNKKVLGVIFLGGACSRCGYSRNLSALDFHHRDPDQKEFTVSSNPNQSWAKLKEELKKCTLLCSNCHREEHNPESHL